jgi:signal transduction histidine kinase
MTTALIELLGQLAEIDRRAEVSKKIAAVLSAEELLIFIKDSELGILLPAVGFTQTLTNSSQWRVFIENCITNICYTDAVSFPKNVTGISYNNECVFVLIGGTPSREMIESVSSVFPLLATILKYEQSQIHTKAQLLLTNKSLMEMHEIEKKLNSTRHELQIALSKTEKEVVERKNIEKQKDEFIGIATHELKTPVTSLKAYAEVLERKFSRSGDEGSAGSLHKMNMQLNKLTNLIEDLLDSIKIDSDKLYMQKEVFDFDQLEIIEEMQRITEKHIIELTGTTRKKILADRERTGQVLTNLISNAIKYSPRADKILVQLAATSTDITVSVKDYGVGIPLEKSSHVFERFYRVSGPTENTFPGLGLGLYISSEIIKREGGRIWVESNIGEGSTFHFSLPVTNDNTR